MKFYLLIDILFSTDPDLINYFGIIFIEIDTSNLNPKYLNNPFLHHKIDGIMYNPLGQITGWYLEVKLALTFRYSIKVLYRYKFDRTLNVFNSFINKCF